MLMSRLGLDTEGFFELDDFRGAVNFTTPETLNALGFATSDIAEMEMCIRDSAKPHDYKAIMTPANCENDGHTTHICMGCGSSFVTDYTEALGHSFDKGTVITNSSCTGEGVTEFRCERCGYHYVEGNAAEGHIPGDETTCTAPQLCTKCGAVIVSALGHSFNSETVAPTCRDMGYTTYTCEHCGESYKSDYVQTTGHKLSDWIIDKKLSLIHISRCCSRMITA